jgi:hypothetical protein
MCVSKPIPHLSCPHRVLDVLNAIIVEASKFYVRADLERLGRHAPLDILKQCILDLHTSMD